jgi:formylglycine-generating enzyme required for sulfatase activity
VHDMSGNVLEWTWDRHGASYPDGDQTDYRGAASGSDRVLRGGSYGVVAARCTVANRENFRPDGQGLGIGFRLVRP